MIRVTYRENLSGQLECSFCGKSFALVGNVRFYRDASGVTHTVPDAQLVVSSHFHDDKNAHIPVCAEWCQLGHVGATPWEAVNEQTGEVVDRGRVIVPMRDNIIGLVEVCRDEPIG